MQAIDLLITARWIVPIAPQNVALDHHAVAVHQGRIVDVLPIAEAEKRYMPETRIDRGTHAIMPGLVNAHAHTPMNLFRGLADDLALMDWLQHHIWPAENALIQEESVHIGSQLAIAEMIRGGTTCFNDNYFFPDVTARAVRDSGIRAALGLIVMSVPTQWAADEKTYFERALSTLQHATPHDRIRWTFCPHAPYTVSDTSLLRLKTLSREWNLPLHMHVHETAFEVEQSLAQYGRRPLARLHQLGLLSPQFMAVHMTQLTQEEIHLVRDTGAAVVHCPESNLKLASGFAPIAQLQTAGVRVAIGTDGAASNNDLDLLGELKTAALLAKAVAQQPTALSAPEALRMATLTGAEVLGWEQEIGSLESGKAADIIAVDLGQLFTQPIYNPISHLVYATGRHQVSDVWVAGRALLANQQLTTLTERPLLEAAAQWAERARPFGVQQAKCAVSA
ncbi:MAG: N-ethylammeline chlorohydrolase [Gammaproteobacteria bacterium RIFCSPHIGHO2_12_FULL_45_9]|nr:MAG: N-ethylammeline chlorohydrolase [Gammaproteobacteria bacterium RIFCSPHIGHO2_12_FULL_45_9]